MIETLKLPMTDRARQQGKIYTLIINVILTSALGTGCSSNKSSSDKAMVTLYFGDPNASSSFQSAAHWGRDLTQFFSTTAPANIDGFQCLGVNVIGEGIAPRDEFPDENAQSIEDLISGVTSCSYAGVTSLPIDLGSNATVSLEVPIGPQRLIQVVGFVDPNDIYCSATIPLGEVPDNGSSSTSSSSEIYEVGRAVVDLFVDTDVTIQNSYNPNDLKALDCNHSGDNFSLYALGDMHYWIDVDNAFNYGYNVGDPVSFMPDFSSYGNHLAYYYGTTPTLQNPNSAGLNGNHVLQFNGTLDNLQSPNSSLSSITGLTVFVVASTVGHGGTEAIFGMNSAASYAGTTDQYIGIKLSAADIFEFYIKESGLSVAHSQTHSADDSYDHIFSMRWESSTGTFRTAVDGSSTSNSGTSSGISLDFGGGYLDLGAWLASSAPTYPLGGDIAEFIFYAQSLSDDNIKKVECYLSQKYGLNVSHSCN